MQQITKEFDNGYAFCAGSLFCVYQVEKTADKVILFGKETQGDTLVFRERIFFSLEQEMPVRRFARALAESQTFPRMMIELAEEYFSSALLE